MSCGRTMRATDVFIVAAAPGRRWRRSFAVRVTLVHVYQAKGSARDVERVQTGVRIEKRILKVMKALAEYHDLTLGDLIEGIVLHAFEGKSAFGTENLKLIADLKNIYHLDLDASASHKLIERIPRRGKRDTVSSTGGRA